MSMSLKTSAEPGFLLAVAGGNFSLADAKRTFVEMLEAVARARVRKVLFDGRGLTGNPKSMERFYYGTFAAEAVMRYAEHGVSRATQFAYVVIPPVLDSRRFGETVAMNRGMHVKAFDNIDDARRWLEIEPACDPEADEGK
jgi:hypothetical protein